MGCGDSKDKKTVVDKTQASVRVRGLMEVGDKEASCTPLGLPTGPDEEAEVLTRAKRQDTIELPPSTLQVDEDVPSQPTFEPQLPPTEPRQRVKFRGGLSVMEGLEELQASLNDCSSPSDQPAKTQQTPVHVDDLLEDILRE